MPRQAGESRVPGIAELGHFAGRSGVSSSRACASALTRTFRTVPGMHMTAQHST